MVYFSSAVIVSPVLERIKVYSHLLQHHHGILKKKFQELWTHDSVALLKLIGA